MWSAFDVVRCTFERVKFNFVAMGTPCSILVYSRDRDRAEKAIATCFTEVKRIESKYSRFNPESIVSMINREACLAPCQVDEETARLIDFAFVCYQESKGAFDITCGALYALWFNGRTELPLADEITEALHHVGLDKISWDGNKIRLPGKEMRIDFGGIGKEYAADRMSSILQSSGIRHGIVNLGGDISIVGSKPDGKGWLIGLAHEWDHGAGSDISDDNAKPRRVIEAFSGGVATSGTRERFVTICNQSFSHVINANTGWPVTGDLSFTVAHTSCLAAGAIATRKLLNV
jgi:thiamine biosynthesis lipoprotein